MYKLFVSSHELSELAIHVLSVCLHDQLTGSTVLPVRLVLAFFFHTARREAASDGDADCRPLCGERARVRNGELGVWLCGIGAPEQIGAEQRMEPMQSGTSAGPFSALTAIVLMRKSVNAS